MEENGSSLNTWQRIRNNQDSLIGNIVIWYLALTVFPLGGFYVGSIASPATNKTVDGTVIRHFYDLHQTDIFFGLGGAVLGLALGACFGLWATFWYPKLKEQDAAEDEAHKHFVHEMASHHDIISTEAGQSVEHVELHDHELE